MTAPASQIQWYLAREGQQYGPLSEAELAKFIELGHLQPNDLLWREGFPDWRPALVLFPQRQAATSAKRPRPDFGDEPASQRPAAESTLVAERSRPAHAARAEPANERPPRSIGAKLRKAVIALILIGGLSASLWLAYPHRARLLEFAASLPTLALGSAVDRKSLEAPPLAGLKGDAKAIDAAMQTAAVWRLVKREFPDWYAQRLKEIEALAASGKDDAAIGQHLARALVTLRRQQVDNALSAQMPNLRRIASAFLENIVQLRKYSTEACYTFISQGESSPVIVGLLQGSPHVVSLQMQMVAIVEAIGDGRRTPRVYLPPRQTDYDLLAVDLGKLGWTKADLQLFSDERALAKAPPDKVCQLVHDWFAAQLAISDADVQQRLLVDSLRPVVAG
jgi:GYF domain 2